MNIFARISKLMCPQYKYAEYLRNRGYSIGRDCYVFKTVNFGSEPYLITIGDHVRLNDGVKLITHDGGLWVLRNLYQEYGAVFKDADRFGKIVIGNNVHIGTDAIIMPGITIGDNSIIACNAVVTHNVDSNTIVGGVPAKKIESLREYAEKNIDRVVKTNSMTAKEKREYIMS